MTTVLASTTLEVIIQNFLFAWTEGARAYVYASTAVEEWCQMYQPVREWLERYAVTLVSEVFEQNRDMIDGKAVMRVYEWSA